MPQSLRPRCFVLTTVCYLVSCFAFTAHRAISAEPFVDSVEPLLRTYCFDCHAGSERFADVVFDEWKDTTAITQDQKLWERVRRVVSRHQMPPADQEQP